MKKNNVLLLFFYSFIFCCFYEMAIFATTHRYGSGTHDIETETFQLTDSILLDFGNPIVKSGETIFWYEGETRIRSGELYSFLSPKTTVNIENGTWIVGVSNGSSGYFSAYPVDVGMLAGGGTVYLGGDQTRFSTFTSASTLRVGGNDGSGDFLGTLRGNGGTIVKIGSGDWNISSATSTYTGETIVQNGRLFISQPTNIGTGSLVISGGSLAILGTATFSNHVKLVPGTGKISVASGQTCTFSGNVTGSGPLHKTGGGQLSLSGVGNYSGKTTVEEGVLLAAASHAFSAHSEVYLHDRAGVFFNLNNTTNEIGGLSGGGSNGGIVLLGNGILIMNTVSTDPLLTPLFSGIIQGGGNLVKRGKGGQSLEGSNTYSGGTTFEDGLIIISRANNLGTGNLIFRGGALRATSSIIMTQDIQLQREGILMTATPAVEITLGGSVSGVGSLMIEGNVIFNGGSADYSGDSVIRDGGELKAGGVNVLSPNSHVKVESAGDRLNLQDFSNIIGNLSGQGSVSLGSGILTVGNSDNAVFSGTISGTGGIEKQGSGTFLVEGTNSYSGGTSLLGGLINIKKDSALGTGHLTFNGGGIRVEQSISTNKEFYLQGNGIVDIEQGVTYTVQGNISDVGGLEKRGDGFLLMSGTANSQTYTGSTRIRRGVIQVGGANVLSAHSLFILEDYSGAALDLQGHDNVIGNLSGGGESGGNINLGSGTLTVGDAQSTSYGGRIDGDGGLVKRGGGSLTLSGENSYTGTTHIQEGILRMGSELGISKDSELSLADVPGCLLDLNGFDVRVSKLSGGGLNGGNILLGSTFIISGNGDSVYAGNIIGSGDLQKLGTGSVSLTGSNTFAGTLFLEDGAIILSSSSALQNAGVSFQGGALKINDTFALDNSFFVDNSGGTLEVESAHDLSFSGILSGEGRLIKSGEGVWTLLGQNSPFTGELEIQEGIVRSGSENSVPSAGTIILADVAGCELDINGHDNMLRNLQGGGLSGGHVRLGDATLALEFTQDESYDGIISGSGNIVKNGAGALSLSNTQTYTGTTTIREGSIITTEINILSPGSMIFENAAGASLRLNDFDQTIGNISGGGSSGGNILLGSGTLTFGDDSIHTIPFGGSIQGSGGIIKRGVGSVGFSGMNNYSGDTEIRDGAIVLHDDDATSPNSEWIFSQASSQLNLDGHKTTVKNISSKVVGAGEILFGAGGVLTTGDASDQIYSGSISGNGGIRKVGSGKLTLSGINTFSGSMDIQQGEVLATVEDAFPDGLDVTLKNDATAILNVRNLDVVLGSLSGGGSAGGSVQLGSGNVTIGNDKDSVFNGTIVGSGGGLTKVGSGMLALTNSSGTTYSGGTFIREGVLSIIGDSSGSSLGTGDITIYNGSTLQTHGDFSLNEDIIFVDGAVFDVVSGPLTVSNVISGSGSMTKKGVGRLILSNGPNTYVGNTILTQGVIETGVAGAISPSGIVQFHDIPGSLLDLNGFDQTVAGIAGGGPSGGHISLGTAILTIVQDANQEYAGNIRGDGGIDLRGSDILTFSGDNSYLGTTNIHSGTLKANSLNALSPYSLFVLDDAGEAKLHVNGFDSTIGGLSGGGQQGGNTFLGGATLTIQNKNQDNVYLGKILEAGHIVKRGHGDLSLFGENEYLGSTTLQQGRLIIQAANNVGRDRIIFDGGVLASQGSFTLPNAMTFLEPGYIEVEGVANAVTLSGSISGNKPLVKRGAGDLLFERMTTNSISGPVHIEEGGIISNGKNSLPSRSDFVLSNVGSAQLHVREDNAIKSLSGGGGIGGTVILDADLTIGQEGDSSDFGGSIIGTGSLIKEGSGSLTLSGSRNTYSGGTTVSEGSFVAGTLNAFPSQGKIVLDDVAGVSLQLNGYNNVIGNLSGGGDDGGDVILDNGAILTLGDADSTVFAGSMSGNGGLIKQGEGTFQVLKPLTYSGLTHIKKGVLQAGAENVLSSDSEVFLENVPGTFLDLNGYDNRIKSLSRGGDLGGDVSLGEGILTVGDNTDKEFLGTIFGEGGIVKNGSGTWKLSGQNAYLGNTEIHEGVVQLGDDGVLPPETSVILHNQSVFDLGGYSSTIGKLMGDAGDVLLRSRQLTVGIPENEDPFTFSGIISGQGGVLEKQGCGTFTLNGINTYDGGTILSCGFIKVSRDENFGTGDVILNGGGLHTTQSFSTSKNFSLNSTGGFFVDNQDFTIQGDVKGDGTIEKFGSGTLILQGDNAYEGMVNIREGVIRAASQKALSLADFQLTNAPGVELDLNNFDSTVRTISQGGDSGGHVNLGSATLTIANVMDTEFSGVIFGSGSIVKDEKGVLTLSGNNVYGGDTRILKGVVRLGRDGALPTGSDVYIFHDPTAILDLNGFSTTIGSLSGGGISGGAVDFKNVTLTFGDENDVSFGGLLHGGCLGHLIKQGTGSVFLFGESCYCGPTKIIDGMLIIEDQDNLGHGSVQFDGGTLRTTTSFSLFRNIDFLEYGGTIDVMPHKSLIVERKVSGEGNFVKTGEGLLTFTSNRNDYSGSTTIQKGILRAGASQAFSPHSDIFLANEAGVRLDLDQFSATIGNLSGGGSSGGHITIDSGNLIVKSSMDTQYSGNISGGGNLIKRGSGELTLDGNNVYYGYTRLEGGMMRIIVSEGLSPNTYVEFIDVPTATLLIDGVASTIRGLAGPSGKIIFDNGGSLIVNNQDNSVFEGVIEGASSGFTKKGPGELILTNTDNDYTGDLSILEGILAVRSAGSLGDGTILFDRGTLRAEGTFEQTNDVQLTQEGTIAVLPFHTLTISGDIAGVGSLNKTQEGTLILTGDSQYSGGTVVLAGMLQGNVRSLQGRIVNDAIVVFDQDVTGTYAGVMSGSGSLVKKNSGKLILTGENTYSGGTFVEGILEGDTTSVQGDIQMQSGGKVIFQQNNLGFHRGDITGKGSMEKFGSGILFLQGQNSYQGGTIIHEGTLQGDTNAVQGDMHNEGVLLFSQDVEGKVYEGEISGTGDVIKDGMARMILSGNSKNFSGNVKVRSGIFHVLGTLLGSYEVSLPGTLSGSGTVGSSVIHGVLAPGSSFGALTIDGDLAMEANSVLKIKIDPDGNNDLVRVLGSADLDGQLLVYSSPEEYFARHLFTILTADNQVSGQFRLVRAIDPFVQIDVIFQPHLVQIEASMAPFAPPPNFLPEDGQNGLNKLWELTRETQDPDLRNVFSVLRTLKKEEYKNAVAQFFPGKFGVSNLIMLENLHFITVSMLQNCQCWWNRCERREEVQYGVYVLGQYFQFAKQNILLPESRADTHGIHGSYAFGEDFIKGIAVGYLHTNTSWFIDVHQKKEKKEEEQQEEKKKILWNEEKEEEDKVQKITRDRAVENTGYCMPFIAKESTYFRWYVTGLGASGFGSADRIISFGDIEREASYGRMHVVGFGKGFFARKFPISQEWILPTIYVSVEGGVLFQSGWKERGAHSLNLWVKDSNVPYIKDSLGVSTTGNFLVNAVSIRPRLDIEWVYTHLFKHQYAVNLKNFIFPEREQIPIESYQYNEHQIKLVAELCLVAPNRSFDFLYYATVGPKSFLQGWKVAFFEEF